MCLQFSQDHDWEPEKIMENQVKFDSNAIFENNVTKVILIEFLSPLQILSSSLKKVHE